MAAQKRIVWLDAAKGFAILLVVAGALLTVLLRNTPGAYQRIPVCNLLIACGITGCAAAILCNVLLSTAVSLGLAVFCQKMGIREMIFQPVKYSYWKRKQ